MGSASRQSPYRLGSTVTSATLELVANADGTIPTSITILGQKALDPARFNATPAARDVWSRRTGAPTAALVPWSGIPDWIAGDRYTSPNLRTVVQEIIDQGGWLKDNSLVLLLEGTGSREIRTYDSGGASSAAQLFLEWVEPPVAAGPQTIGLRFEDVRIPQNMGINSAVIEFRPREDGAGAAALRVRAEASDDSAAFAATANNLTDPGLRPKTVTSVLWNPAPADWKAGVPHQTADLTAIVKEVVARTGWCGGNAMTFFIDDVGSTGPRIAFSADSDASLAPVLRIDYDKTRPPGPGEGCTIREISAQPSIAADDANQLIASVDPATPINTANDFMEFEAGSVNGLRFQGLEIPPGVEITAANIVFKAAATTPAGASADPLNITFEGHATASAPAFDAGSGLDVLSRTSRTSAVTWTSVPAWAAGTTYTSPDLSAIVEEIVNGGIGWDTGQHLAILMKSDDTGKRFAVARERSPADSPRLRISMRAKIGDLPSIPVTTVRQRLKQIVNELDHGGYTPIVDTLYEAAVYYRGEQVKWGLDRGNGSRFRQALDPGQSPELLCGWYRGARCRLHRHESECRRMHQRKHHGWSYLHLAHQEPVPGEFHRHADRRPRQQEQLQIAHTRHHWRRFLCHHPPGRRLYFQRRGMRYRADQIHERSDQGSEPDRSRQQHHYHLYHRSRNIEPMAQGPGHRRRRKILQSRQHGRTAQNLQRHRLGRTAANHLIRNAVVVRECL